jgi:autotransporter-associated beta strand protein
MNGPGTLALTAASSYTGGTTVTSGLINFNAANNFGSGGITLNAGGLQWAAGNTADISGRLAAIGSGGATFDYNGNAVTLATALSGARGVTVANSGSGGSLTLTAAENYSGPTIINSGATLALKSTGSIANSLYVAFSPGGSASGLDISQTTAGASVAGLFDPTGMGVVSLGAKTLTITNNVGPFNGVIQDGGIGGGTGGSLMIANGGLATFGGANTYTGLTAINNGGELDLVGNGSIAHSKAVINNGIFDITGVTGGGTSIASLSGANTGVVNLGINTLTITNANGTFAGVIQDSGTGSLAITGGKEILTGINTYTGSTTITGATLEVDGSIANSSSVTVNSGGTLSGTGIVDPATTTIMSGGTLAPGSAANPTGTLTITGNLAFQSGAIYLVQVTSSAAASTNVSGTATLTGATVNAQFAFGNSVSKTYIILTAAGGLGGTTFAGITNANLPAGASDSLSYDANNVYLNLKAGFSNYTGLSVNQQNVANALTNFFNTTGGIPAAFFGLSPGGLTQVDGEAATAAERAVFQLTNEFLALMLDPFVNGRGNIGGTGGTALGFAPDQQTNLPPDVALAYASILTKAPPQNFEQRWTAWGSAFGGANRTNGDAAVGSNTTTASTYGFAGGMDYHFTPHTVAGFALAGAGTSWGLANALGTGRSDALQAGAYGISWFGPAYVLQSLVHHRPQRARRSAQRQLRRPELWRAARRWLSLRGAVDIRGDAVRRRSVPGLQYAGLQRGGCDGRRLRAVLRRDERDRRAHRAWRLLRRADAGLWQAAGALRPCRLGARLCLNSDAQRRIPSAAGRRLHRQRRADPARLGADQGRRAIVPDAAMDLARQVRWRVRQRLADLRRLWHAAVRVVKQPKRRPHERRDMRVGLRGRSRMSLRSSGLHPCYS